MQIQPVIPEESEILRYSVVSVSPVVADKSEIDSIVGLPCGFCGRYCKTIGTESTSVTQTQVTDDGLEYKRWGGGDIVWICGRCVSLGRKISLKGQKIVTPVIPEATGDDVRLLVSRSVYDAAQRQKWK